VNTAAVHALAYPLGGEYHLAHGLSNSLLLPAVMRFNIPAAPTRYAEVARALGAPAQASVEETAHEGVKLVSDLARRCGLPTTLKEVGIAKDAIGCMATAAMKVTRLLKNNPRELSAADAESIYQEVYE
jgi:alcohol dehydrogenase class IV